MAIRTWADRKRLAAEAAKKKLMGAVQVAKNVGEQVAGGVKDAKGAVDAMKRQQDQEQATPGMRAKIRNKITGDKLSVRNTDFKEKGGYYNYTGSGIEQYKLNDKYRKKKVK